MNLAVFEEFMKFRPAQNPPEWKMYLEFCEMYLTRRGIQNPLVVELGILHSNQKKFYEQILGATYIGIDIKDDRSRPDILGDTHHRRTLRALKDKLAGREIDILFIDAGHSYDAVKQDFEMYSPLCSGIVAFHDIETGREGRMRRNQVWKFWDELKEVSYIELGKYEDFMFISIRQCRFQKKRSRRMGIGLMIKR